MAKWFGQADTDEEAGKAVEKKFETLETEVKASKQLGEDNKTTLEAIKAGIDAQNARYAAEDAARTKAANDKKKADYVAPTQEERVEALLNDPDKFINERVSATTRVAIMAVAKQTRAEVLGAKEYYHGDFKKQVDALIESTTDITQTTMPQYLENCYNVVLGQNMDKIMKGEMKKSTSLHSFSDGGNSGKSGTESGPVKVEYRDNKSSYAAKAMGLTDEDFEKAAKEQAIHGLEVVA
jgi:hypothetical protein